MTTRRDLIRNILSSMKSDLPQNVENSDCKTVSQINVFAGGSINISFSHVENVYPEIEACSNETYFDDKQRERVNKICHGIAKEYSLYPQMRKYMKEKWKVSSMRDLKDKELHSLLQYLRTMESIKKRK